MYLQQKAHFSQILEKVINSEKFIITKHVVQVNLNIPFTKEKEVIDPVKDAIRAVKKLRKGITLGKKLLIKKMLDKGRN